MCALPDFPRLLAAIASDGRLTARMTRALLAIAARVDEATGEADLSPAELEEATGLDASHLRRAVADLQAEGFISVAKEGHRRRYTVAENSGQKSPESFTTDGGQKRADSARKTQGDEKAGRFGPENSGQKSPEIMKSGPIRPGNGEKAGRIGPEIREASPPRVSPPTPPSSRPPVCVPGGVPAGARTHEGEPFEPEGPAVVAFSPAKAPEVSPEEEADRRKAREFAEQFAPQLAYDLRQLFAVYPGSLVLYALQQSAAKRKLRSIAYAQGICREQLAAGWVPPSRAAPAATSPQPPIAAPAFAPRPSRNAALQEDAMERYRRFRAAQEAANKENAS